MPRRYRVELLPSAVRELERLRAPMRHRVATAIDGLQTEPRPPGVVQLRGASGVLRLPVGDHRILYLVIDDRLVVLVVRVGHRREVYRQVARRLGRR